MPTSLHRPLMAIIACLCCSQINAQCLVSTHVPQDPNFVSQTGHAVAIDGVNAVMGTVGIESATYIFRFQDGGWLQQAKLLSNDAFDTFGASVDIDGIRLAVGAPRDSQVRTQSGAAFVYVLEAGVWELEASLTPIIAADFDNIGSSVGISGDWLVTGAEGDDLAGTNAGVAYVYRRFNGQWSLYDILRGQQTQLLDRFGRSIAIDGDRIVIGSPLANDGRGAVDIFQLKGGVSWVQEDRLIPANGDDGDLFGSDVAIHGENIVVGMPGDDDDGVDAGAAIVYRYAPTNTASGSFWFQEAKLTPGEPAVQMGTSVAIEANKTLVGAPRFKNSRGGVFVHDFFENAWHRTGVIDPGRPIASTFGSDVALAGDIAMAGAPGNEHNGIASGSALLFELPVQCPGDVTGNGVVNAEDLEAVLDHWGVCQQSCPDTNDDQRVDVVDLITVINDWSH